jgi:hypothetical protein
MMNNVSELHSLVEFLRIKPYCDVQRFNHVSSWLTRASDTRSCSATFYRGFIGCVLRFFSSRDTDSCNASACVGFHASAQNSGR